MGRTISSTREGLLFLLVCLFAVLVSVSSANLPCAAREETSGYVCVCNTTYCDTLERPKELKSGKYYHYSTSATKPGFNLKTGSFDADGENAKSTSSINFVVDSSLTYQTFQGIGAGLSDSAAINFNILTTKLQTYFVQSFFGVKGLEYVFGRVPIGATDFSTRTYSYDDVSGDVNLTHFALVDEDLNLRIPMIKKIKKVSKRGLQLLATAWTAPAWMKLNNSTDIGFLSKQYESSYAQYLVRYLEEYQNQGVDFWGLSQGNEVIMGYQSQFHMPNMVVMPPQMKTWTRDYLGPLMKSKFPDVKIIAVDDERTFLDWYARELLDDEDTVDYLDGAALHWYFDMPQNTDVMDNFYTKYPGKFLIYTESSLGGGGPHSNHLGATDMGSWSNAEEYITDILQNFNHFVSGYMDWNICLNEQGGPFQQMSLSPSVVVNTTTGKEFYKQPFFYVLGHFSKFLPPGAVRINVTSDQNSTNSYTYDILDVNLDGSGPQPSGQPGPQPTGQPGPPPSGQPGPQPSGQPGPQPTSTPTNELSSVASVNPDGSYTFIVYNPRSESVDITISDKQKNTKITKTLTAQSLNTFLYW